MTTFDTEDRQALEDAAREFLDQRSSSKHVRAVIDGDGRYDLTLWREMADLGWAGLIIPEEFGGAGVGLAAASVIAQALGAHATPCPYLSSAVLTPLALIRGGGQAAAEWLPRLATGEATGTVALTSSSGRMQPGLFDVTAEPASSGGWTLTGHARFVLDPHADVIIVGARSAESTVILAVPATSGAMVEELPSVDRSREVGHLDFTGVQVGADAALAEGPAADELVDVLVDAAAVALAADAAGAADAALRMSVDYAKQRVQFDRVIGSFQAIKHKLADMYVLTEAAKATVRAAAESFDVGGDQMRRRAATAGSFVRQSAGRVVGDAMQAHGGIGFTWEHDCHLLLKRAKFDEFFMTDLWSQRERLVESVGAHAAAESSR